MQDNASPLRRMRREPERLEVLNLLSLLSHGEPLHFGDQLRIDLATDKFGRLATTIAGGPQSTLDGWRAQFLFEATVASLGRVRLLKGEDSGDVYYAGDDIRTPDFRVVDATGHQFLVEVKLASREVSSDLAVEIRRKDADAYRRYADLVGVGEVRVAVYWASTGMWTLTALDSFVPTGSSKMQLRFLDALRLNGMTALGDSIVATEWPIGLTLASDARHPRSVRDDGTVQFTIGDAYFSVAGKRLANRQEESIAYMMMRYGGWEIEDSAEIVDGQLISIKITAAPIEPPIGQVFAMHRPLSSVFARRADELTTSADGETIDLRLDPEPSRLRQLIPDDYEGEVLQLWRFLQQGADATDL